MSYPGSEISKVREFAASGPSERFGYSWQRIPSVLLKVIALITKGAIYVNAIKDLLKEWAVAQMNIVPKGIALVHVLILTNAMLEHIRLSPISTFVKILTLIDKFPGHEQDRNIIFSESRCVQTDRFRKRIQI